MISVLVTTMLAVTVHCLPQKIVTVKTQLCESGGILCKKQYGTPFNNIIIRKLTQKMKPNFPPQDSSQCIKLFKFTKAYPKGSSWSAFWVKIWKWKWSNGVGKSEISVRFSMTLDRLSTWPEAFCIFMISRCVGVLCTLAYEGSVALSHPWQLIVTINHFAVGFLFGAINSCFPLKINRW